MSKGAILLELWPVEIPNVFQVKNRQGCLAVGS